VTQERAQEHEAKLIYDQGQLARPSDIDHGTAGGAPRAKKPRPVVVRLAAQCASQSASSSSSASSASASAASAASGEQQ
jgi:hypothetical protein